MPPLSITVAVCADGPPPDIATVIDALRAQGVEPQVVRAPEIAIARNTALAGCDSDVLAYVDDDVVVGEGWWERLHAAWAEAGDDVGALGGPIDGARAAVDYGSEALDLDASRQTLYAGNLSF